MTDYGRRWQTANRNDPHSPADDIPPNATHLVVSDCGSPICRCAHIVLVDGHNDIGLAQATISLPIVLDMLKVILNKTPKGELK